MDVVDRADLPFPESNEFTFRFNRRFYPSNAFRSLLGIAAAWTESVAFQ